MGSKITRSTFPLLPPHQKPIRDFCHEKDRVPAWRKSQCWDSGGICEICERFLTAQGKSSWRDKVSYCRKVFDSDCKSLQVAKRIPLRTWDLEKSHRNENRGVCWGRRFHRRNRRNSFLCCFDLSSLRQNCLGKQVGTVPMAVSGVSVSLFVVETAGALWEIWITVTRIITY